MVDNVGAQHAKEKHSSVSQSDSSGAPITSQHHMTQGCKHVQTASDGPGLQITQITSQESLEHMAYASIHKADNSLGTY